MSPTSPQTSPASSQKSPVSLQKSPSMHIEVCYDYKCSCKSALHPRKRVLHSRKRALHLWKRVLICMLTWCSKRTSAREKELCINANEPYITAKEPYISSKELCIISEQPYITTKEPYISAKELCTISKEPYVTPKEPYIFAKEPCIPARVCTLTRCGDVTCSAATTIARVTSTPRPATTVRNSTWGRRYTLVTSTHFWESTHLSICTCVRVNMHCVLVFVWLFKPAYWSVISPISKLIRLSFSPRLFCVPLNSDQLEWVLENEIEWHSKCNRLQCTCVLLLCPSTPPRPRPSHSSSSFFLRRAVPVSHLLSLSNTPVHALSYVHVSICLRQRIRRVLCVHHIHQPCPCIHQCVMSLYTSMSHVRVYVNESCLLCKESCLYVHRISSLYTYDSEYAECSVNFTYMSHVSVYINRSCLYIQRVTSIHIQQRVLGALFTSCTRVMSLYTSMSPYTSCNACVWHEAFIRETWLIHMMKWLFHWCDTTLSTASTRSASYPTPWSNSRTGHAWYTFSKVSLLLNLLD